MNSIYVEQGYKNRKDYLETIADNYCVPVGDVFTLASILGSDEDFDGLVTRIEDYAATLD